MVKMFIDDESRVDKEALRVYVLQHLEAAHERVQYLKHNPSIQTRWHELRDLVYSEHEHNEAYKQGIELIEHLDEQLHVWIHDHLDAPERFEFSVQTKALELNSGDQDYDYYMALMIRHDQFLSVVLVFEEIIKIVEKLLTSGDITLQENGSWNYLIEKTVDVRIFEIAEEMYRQRTNN